METFPRQPDTADLVAPPVPPIPGGAGRGGCGSLVFGANVPAGHFFTLPAYLVYAAHLFIAWPAVVQPFQRIHLSLIHI